MWTTVVGMEVGCGPGLYMGVVIRCAWMSGPESAFVCVRWRIMLLDGWFAAQVEVGLRAS